MKNVLRIAAALMLIIILGSCRNTSDSIVLGCLSPLTGEGATYGRSTRRGVELAVDEINAQKRLPKTLRVIFEDDKMSPKDGVSAFQKLVSVDRVPLVIGPFGSSIVLASAPIANESKTVIITASATADKIADAGDFVFRIVPPNSKQGADLAQFCIAKLHSKRAAILYQTNDYGMTLRDAFDKTFRELGGTVVGAEGYPLGSTDYRAALTKLKPLKPDVIFYPLHQAEAALMLRQAKELGFSCDTVSADGAYTEDLIKAAGSAAEGSYFSTMALAYGAADDAISRFQNAFKAKFNQDPDVYSAYYYEVTNLVADVIGKNGVSGEQIQKGLSRITGDMAYHGITGQTAFDAKGEVDKSFYIYQVRNGAFHLVGPPK
jgi:branched-chain amino acid transport system substrate-binding protein